MLRVSIILQKSRHVPSADATSFQLFLGWRVKDAVFRPLVSVCDVYRVTGFDALNE
jgi:hypothetical protein